LVKQVHQDEGMENNGVKNESISRLSKVISEWCGDQVEALIKENELAEIHQENAD